MACLWRFELEEKGARIYIETYNIGTWYILCFSVKLRIHRCQSQCLMFSMIVQ